MKRNDFVFCIGYQGDSAIIDKRLSVQAGDLGTRELLAKGLYKAALCSAMWDENQEDLEFLLREYNKKSLNQYPGIEALKRALGVSAVHKNIQRTVYL